MNKHLPTSRCISTIGDILGGRIFQTRSTVAVRRITYMLRGCARVSHVRLVLFRTWPVDFSQVL